MNSTLLKNKKNIIYHKVTLLLKAGKGGNGIINFYKNKYMNFGKADGGNGGNGGNIYVIALKKINNLHHYYDNQLIQAPNGNNGKTQNKTGKNGKNIILFIPVNTTIYNANTQENIITLTKNKQKYLLAKGGKHGIGNTKFKSSINRSPMYFTKGELGETQKITLIYQNNIDIIIIGLPNTGKSSLFNLIIGKKQAKIAKYPFTTTYPNYGIYNNEYKKKINIIDMPALSYNCHKKPYSLGIKYLKHILNCKLILHLITVDTTTNIIFNNIKILLHELYQYNKIFAKKEQWLIFNKKNISYKRKNIINIINLIKKIKWNKPYFIISTYIPYTTKKLIKWFKQFIKKYKNKHNT